MAVILKKRTLVLGLALTALAAVLVGLSAGDMEPWAPPASTLKPLSEVEPRRVIWGEFLPLVISEEGSSWYLGESISFTGAEHGITIEADDVTIDLNGFVLSGPGFGNGDGIHVIAGRSGVPFQDERSHASRQRVDRLVRRIVCCGHRVHCCEQRPFRDHR